MDYERTVRECVDEKIESGVTADEAYCFVINDIRNLQRTATRMSQRTVTPSNSTIEDLKGYARKRGFQNGGDWFFGSSWLGKKTVIMLEESGYIKRIGTSTDLNRLGISHTLKGRRGGALFYRLNAGKVDIISSLIPAPQGAGLQQRVELFAHAKTSEIFAVLEDVIPPTLCFTAKSRRLFACARSKTSCCICCLKTAVFNIDKMRT